MSTKGETSRADTVQRGIASACFSNELSSDSCQGNADFQHLAPRRNCLCTAGSPLSFLSDGKVGIRERGRIARWTSTNNDDDHSNDEEDALAPKIFLTRQIHLQRIRWPCFTRATVLLRNEDRLNENGTAIVTSGSWHPERKSSHRTCSWMIDYSGIIYRPGVIAERDLRWRW